VKAIFDLDSKLEFAKTDLDVLAVGEILSDLISTEEVSSFKEAEQFNRYFGGSPANISINLSNLGANSALLSKVGADGIGSYLKERLVTAGVDTSGIVTSEEHNTSIVLVTQSKESPQFIAYRDAEKYITTTDIKEELITATKIVHLSTFALSAPVTRKTIVEIVRLANQANKLVSLDPNYRPQLWEGAEDGPEFIKNLLAEVNIVKPSLDDARALFGPEKSPREYIAEFHNAGVDLVILTLGAQGVMISTGTEELQLDSVASEVIDTTGAGDAFWSGFYASLVDGDRLKTAVEVGNRIAALALREVGALVEMPTKDQIRKQFKI